MTGPHRLRVAVDFDGVTAELPTLPDSEACRAALRDAPCDSLRELLTDTPDDFDPGAFAEEHPEAVRQTLLAPDPVQGARDALRRMQEAGHDVVIVTNRPQELRPFTLRWLDEHDVPHDEVKHVGSACRKGTLPDVDVVIDDTPHNALAAAESANLGILFNRSWSNADAVRDADGAVVAADWRAATRHVPGAAADPAVPDVEAAPDSATPMTALTHRHHG